MADIRCTVCGEAWDMDTLHDEADESRRTLAAVRNDFRKRGCAAINSPHATIRNTAAAEASAILFDMLGDDIDGIAAMLEDGESFGLFD